MGAASRWPFARPRSRAISCRPTTAAAITHRDNPPSIEAKMQPSR
jgi:hypothetical protein